MKENSKDKSESGQIVILLALAFVGILAFTALAIDGAMIFSDRRIAQNGADAASISGAQAVGDALLALGGSATYLNWDCDTLQAQGVLSTGDGAAITHAGIVDFLIDNNINDNNGVSTECFNIFNGTYYETFIDVPVKITDDTPTAFLHLITNGTVRNEVEVKTRVYPATQAGYGMTLLALDEDEDSKGLEIKGGPAVDIEVGGIVSNSNMKIGGTGPDDSQVVVVDGEIVYIDDYTDPGSPTVSPNPISSTVPIDDPNIPDPVCDSSWVQKDFPNNDGSVTQGLFGTVKVNGGQTVTMGPGLYCVDGNFTVNAGAVLTGTNVTIYMMTGKLTINGSATANLSAPESDGQVPPGCLSANCPPALPGVLIYMPHENTNTIDITGNNTSTYGGTIYAPESHVQIGGTSSTDDVVNMGIQIIAKTIKVAGTADLNFDYTGEDIYIGNIKFEIAK